MRLEGPRSLRVLCFKHTQQTHSWLRRLNEARAEAPLSLGAREMGHAPVTHASEEGPVPQAGQLKLALHSPGLGKHRWVVGVRVGITTRLGGGVLQSVWARALGRQLGLLEVDRKRLRGLFLGERRGIVPHGTVGILLCPRLSQQQLPPACLATAL